MGCQTVLAKSWASSLMSRAEMKLLPGSSLTAVLS